MRGCGAAGLAKLGAAIATVGDRVQPGHPRSGVGSKTQPPINDRASPAEVPLKDDETFGAVVSRFAGAP